MLYSLKTIINRAKNAINIKYAVKFGKKNENLLVIT